MNPYTNEVIFTREDLPKNFELLTGRLRAEAMALLAGQEDTPVKAPPKSALAAWAKRKRREKAKAAKIARKRNRR